MKSSRAVARSLAALCALLLVLCARESRAENGIIKHPGQHPNYPLELEPHLVAQYERTPYTNGGFGIGLRASIPFVHNGPVPQINNNIGMSFGVDFVHFGTDSLCYRGRGWVDFYTEDCSATDLWFPVTGQWNFFLTPIISVFGEFGLSAHYTSWSYDGFCNGVACAQSYSHFDFFEPVFWAGGRFMFARSAGLLVRLGWPYVSVGAAFWF
jgi:hypothetical protein